MFRIWDKGILQITPLPPNGLLPHEFAGLPNIGFCVNSLSLVLEKSVEMTDEDQVSFSSSPDFENTNAIFEGNAEQDYRKARDESLPISEVNKQPSV